MTDALGRVRRRVVVHGRVQGVWFRGATQEEARRLGVGGWVRNRRDGTVEAVFEGDPVAVEQMVSWAHSGPQFARVSSVEVADAASGDPELGDDPSGPLRDFEIR